MRKDAPLISGIEGKSINGFYRKGISQDNNSFLECIDTIHCINKNNSNIKRYKPNLELFKKNIIKDINNSDFDIFSVGGGSFVQYFRSEELIQTNNIIQKIKEDVINNFKEYLYSNEPKDERLLISLFMKISELKNNKTFENNTINIIVFNENNEKISIIEPIGKLKILDNKPYAFIYKSEGKYEPMIYYYNNSSYGYVLYENDITPLKKGNDIHKIDILFKKIETFL